MRNKRVHHQDSNKMLLVVDRRNPAERTLNKVQRRIVKAEDPHKTETWNRL
ncbi:MAG: hypothetical protein ACP5PQ_03820 [Thermoproteota archaeon]